MLVGNLQVVLDGHGRRIADLDEDGDTGEVTPLDGEGRFFDDPNTPDTGCGSSAIEDMGAYDLDNDRDGDLVDLAKLLGNYGETCE